MVTGNFTSSSKVSARPKGTPCTADLNHAAEALKEARADMGCELAYIGALAEVIIDSVKDGDQPDIFQTEALAHSIRSLSSSVEEKLDRHITAAETAGEGAGRV